jgi:hypothetical protein
MQISNQMYKGSRIFLSSLLFALSLLLPTPVFAATNQIDIPGPPDSGTFGESVTVLNNGNFVVEDSTFNENRGAVYLYNPDGELISRLTGDLPNDAVGSRGIYKLTNGNYIVISPSWSSGSDPSQNAVGAVTWCSQLTGCDGVVSAANSLIGSTAGDNVGDSNYSKTYILANGNYVIRSSRWDYGSIVDAGAVTWGNGNGGTVGVVSASNSLVGSSANDRVGECIPYETADTLANGNYLVCSPNWDNGSIVDAGAVTWGNGNGGTVGEITAENSLVGSSAHDQVGNWPDDKVIELTNGNYVVVSTLWDLDETHQDAGAVTWGNGTTGVSGIISASNSLIGNSQYSPVGDINLDDLGVTALTNGNYVVASPHWYPDKNDSNTHGVGAVTWGSGTTGVVGQISTSNSLVGFQPGIFDTNYDVTPLTNGNYVVSCPDWAADDIFSHAGAVTWGNGAVGTRGVISASNSLVGHLSVYAGSGGVVALTNGNYVVTSPYWSDGTGGPTNAGAVTWGDGSMGTTGEISSANSLVGSDLNDQVGGGTRGGVIPLVNGNYVVHSPMWDNDTSQDVGAVTWGNGAGGTTGVVSTSNSFVGSTTDDNVGGDYGGGVIGLRNGNYVVYSPSWHNGIISDAGAVTWGNGTSGTAGVVSPSNSLVGTTALDGIGDSSYWEGVFPLNNGNYIVVSPMWTNGEQAHAGAVTWGNGTGGTIGPISAENSLVGTKMDDKVGGGVCVVAGGITLVNGNYLIISSDWSDSNGRGAITVGNGSGGTVGTISSSNSLENTYSAATFYCITQVTHYSDGNVSIRLSYKHEYDAIGLITGYPNTTVGLVSATNSVVSNSDQYLVSDYDAYRSQLIVGRPNDNVVTILKGNHKSRLYLPDVSK